MSIKQPIPQRRCVNYRKVEAPVYRKMESELCENYGLTYSELVKQCVRKEYNSTKNIHQLSLI